MFVSVYKPHLQNNDYSLDTLIAFLDFQSGIYDNKVVFGNFNLEATNPVMINFMDSQNFTNLIKKNTCFEGVSGFLYCFNFNKQKILLKKHKIEKILNPCTQSAILCF